MVHTVVKEVRGKSISIETGKMARQSAGAVVVRSGGTIVLATANVAAKPREGADFFPLTVDYIEKMYASGKIPGGFYKREAKPTTVATLTARLIDRPIRPLFPEGFRNDVHIVVTVLSYDGVNTPDVLGMIGASAALSLSQIPFQGPIAGVNVGLINGEFVLNPSLEELETSELDLTVAGTVDAVMMVEAGAKEVSEEKLIEAIEFGHAAIKEIIALQQELVQQVGQSKMEFQLDLIPEDVQSWVDSSFRSKLESAIRIEGKQDRYDAIAQVREQVLEAAQAKFGDTFAEEYERSVVNAFEALEKKIFRALVTKERIRADGRKTDQIRPLSSEVGILPCTHGSALFTRGETQSLAVTTLGTVSDEQIIDGLDVAAAKRFYLHYNFPPFSVGEVGFMRGPGRRELGHGALAERAIGPVMPASSEFPYTVRLVSDILESNGSSSMASVCGGILSLMDAGVPIKKPVAGVAMGLIASDGHFVVLTDIMGLEDHLGDMDFKVCGTTEGVTALQMDIKITGVTREILKQALEQARAGRMKILEHMTSVIAQPRSSISPYAPRIETIEIAQDKIGMLIGPGGKTIKSIIDETGVKIDIANNGIATVSSVDEASLNAAKAIIMGIVRDVEVGDIYTGKVTRIMNFGAFVEIAPGKEGLLHISQIAERRLKSVDEVLSIGDKVTVKVIEVDSQGRYNLSAKGLK